MDLRSKKYTLRSSVSDAGKTSKEPNESTSYQMETTFVECISDSSCSEGFSVGYNIQDKTEGKRKGLKIGRERLKLWKSKSEHGIMLPKMEGENCLRRFAYDDYKEKDMFLGTWWKNVIDLYDELIVTNLMNQVSNLEFVNMHYKENRAHYGFQFLNEGVLLFHNTSKSDENVMSILRVNTIQKLSEDKESDTFHSHASKIDLWNDDFKKYYYSKNKNVPIMKRYRCMRVPYYTVRSSISYFGSKHELRTPSTQDEREDESFGYDENALLANKSIHGKIFLYSLRKSIERINEMEEADMEDQKEREAEEDEEEKAHVVKRKGMSYYLERKEKEQKEDTELLLELKGHNTCGKGLMFSNNYLLSSGEDKKILIYDVNGHPQQRNGTMDHSKLYDNVHTNVASIHPLISIKTDETYSNTKWLYDSLVIGGTYNGYFSMFDIRMKNGSTDFASIPNGYSSKKSNMFAMHKKITNYEISDLDKYNTNDNNLICLSSMNNIFIFDLRYLNNNVPYKILHDRSYNNFSTQDMFFEPVHTERDANEYSNAQDTNINCIYDLSYNTYHDEDFHLSNSFIHSLFWCNIEGFNYIGALNNKGSISIYDMNRVKHQCIFSYGCKYIKLFKYNPYKPNNFITVDKNNIMILFSLPNHLYMSDFDIYLGEKREKNKD